MSATFKSVFNNVRCYLFLFCGKENTVGGLIHNVVSGAERQPSYVKRTGGGEVDDVFIVLYSVTFRFCG